MQRGSHQLIIIAVVVIILLGVIGFVFWKNFVATPSTDTAKTQTAANTSDTKWTDEAAERSTVDTPKNDEELKDYLVLKEWGLKFKIPEGAGEIRYYHRTAAANDKGVDSHYRLSTKRVEDLGGMCATAKDGTGGLAAMTRTKKLPDDGSVSDGPINNGKPINGYYYLLSAAQSYCTTDESHRGIQEKDREMLNTMLQHPEAL